MPEKGTLCHAETRSKTCEGVSRLHGLIWGGRGLEGREKAFGVFLSGSIVDCGSLCKLKFMFPCVNVIPIQGSP